LAKTRNLFEASTHRLLTEKAQALGLGLKYEPHKIKYVIDGHYLPDFLIEFPSGHKRYIETKGYLRRQDIVKMTAVRKTNPKLDIRIFFMQDKIISGKMTYGRWAEKVGFPYCIGQMPEDWFVE
jgi:hypothetical protein